MRFLEKINQLCTGFTSKLSGLLALVLIAFIGLSGCGSSGSGNKTGFFKFYNASSTSPAVFIELDESSLSSVEYGSNSTLYELNTDTYEMELSWEEDSDEYEVFYEADLKISNDDSDLVVLVGDIDAPEVLTYEYEDENPDEEDDVFAMRFINLYSDDVGVDVYYSEDDETFNEAVLFGDMSYSYKDMSDSQLIETQTYKFYITEAGSSEVLYESDEIQFLFTTQYIMIVRANTGPGSSPYTIDKITKTSQVVEYADLNSSAELRFYNAIIGHDLITPAYNGSVDLNLINVAGVEEVIAGIDRSSFSDIIEGERGDLSLDIYPAGGSEPFDEDSYLGVLANEDKTVFLYTTVIEDVDDRDSSTTEEVEVFIDTLTVANSTTISVVSHNVKVINFVDDYSLLGVYFVRDGETLTTADYLVNSQRATPQTISLPNNTYRVQIVYTTDTGTAKTLASQEIVLDETSQDMFLIIEGNEIDTTATSPEDMSEEVPYTITYVEQNDF